MIQGWSSFDEHRWVSFGERRSHGLWLPSATPPTLEERFAIVASFARTIGRLGMANFVYVDGDALFAHGNKRRDREIDEPRPPGLFVLHRDCATSRSEFCAQGLQISSVAESQEMTLVASVPLTSENWQPLECGEVLAFRQGEILVRAR